MRGKSDDGARAQGRAERREGGNGPLMRREGTRKEDGERKEDEERRFEELRKGVLEEEGKL